MRTSEPMTRNEAKTRPGLIERLRNRDDKSGKRNGNKTSWM